MKQILGQILWKKDSTIFFGKKEFEKETSYPWL